MRINRWLAFTMALSVLSFALPFSVSAATCSALGGKCYGVEMCAKALAVNPQGECVDADDCKGKGFGGACLVRPATCTDSGGHCFDGGICDSPETNESIGTMDCFSGQTCCRPKTVAPATAAPGEPATEEKATPSFDRLVLPSCTKTGNCTVNDIIQTGVNFASFLMGLSGGLFLIVFIYGGAMYLLSFGDKARVDKGKKAIKGAAFGIIIVMGSWAIVQTIYSTLVPSGGGGKSSDKKKTCTDLGVGWACKAWTGKTAAAVQQEASKAGFSCQTGYCEGDFHHVCCKSK